eukprot:CAMPEP_0171062360 /NCGR_PEP_ID=MMETSP0766_2-20121228/5019_1 /TAXON_ID=439317 /ORGANISM="Gambierdiscus australes, Strain CAWD 149" /LENGTH=87 /DNA_ID=CAMNT_0011518157 /DNA_START=150 /DNA_END=413 /DNA_ORIENTATION=+
MAPNSRIASPHPHLRRLRNLPLPTLRFKLDEGSAQHGRAALGDATSVLQRAQLITNFKWLRCFRGLRELRLQGTVAAATAAREVGEH